jgi:hypothetical protein
LKGYELYSWYEGADWRFALVEGSNRIKAFEELTAPDVAVDGLEELKDQLMRLPEGETVHWSSGQVPGTVLAPAEIVDQVRSFCKDNALVLEIAD